MVTYGYDSANGMAVRSEPVLGGELNQVYLRAGGSVAARYQYTWEDEQWTEMVQPMPTLGGREIRRQDRIGSAVAGLLPYGEDPTGAAHTGSTFATYWRDNPLLDYANQRWYAVGWGRFTSADASGYAEPSDLGSWNQYSYVQGDPVNYIDASGDFRIPVLSGIGNFFGGLFGIVGRAAPLPMPNPVRFSAAERQRVHKQTTDTWVLELAAAVAVAASRNDESERPLRYPMYLAVAEDRCSRFGNGPVQRNIKYELYDNTGEFMSGTTIREHLVALEGSLPVTESESSSPPGGMYNDQLSALIGGSRVLLQRFKVTTLPGIDDYQSVVDMPVFVRGFGGDWGVLYLDIRTDSVKVQGVGGPGCGR
jgi:RHS repeat-associated protein